jgi:hypothetical protein
MDQFRLYHWVESVDGGTRGVTGVREVDFVLAGLAGSGAIRAEQRVYLLSCNT